VAYDSDGDGAWDWIYSNYDTNNDGNPDVNLSSLEEADVTLQKTVPVTLKSKADLTTITATAATNSSISNNATARCVYTLTQKVKNLYMHENGGTDQMDTFIGTGSSSTSVQISDDNSHVWQHSPVFASDFNITDNISVYLYIDPTAGTGFFTEGNPDVEVVFTYGSTYIGSFKVTDITTTQWYTFTVTSAVDYIPAGNAITMTVNVDSCNRGFRGRDGWVDIYYDSSTYDSRIDLPTDTYIAIDELDTYNLTTDNKQTEFIANDFVEIRANVSDPLGVQDMSAYVYITSPGGTYGDLVNGVAMSNFTTDPTSPYFWQVYNFSYLLSALPINGTYTVNVVAFETNGVFVNRTTTFIVPGPNVSVTPDHYSTEAPGTNVSYSHTIKNNAPFADRFELSVSSTQGWNITLYNDSNGNGALDPGEGKIAVDTGGDGSWNWVNSSFDSDSDGNPDTGLLGADQTFKIMVEIQIPANVGLVVDRVKVTATSDYDTSVSDFAVDTIVIVPEYESLLIPLAIMFFLILTVKRDVLKKRKNALFEQ
jgi:hypothetical protein